ncbi:hypothetical protein HNR46_003818 [Haloferula luteola]|uniref:Plant Basic Secretory Protein n=1 Tax=Haloferula luteola TaxID=595692 RepID=A0A840V5N6_9BACT|nr:basic secretory protein-like protein [Haloferula luteola]MBB5353557.1 hypothetical protein [Haloferula luteola]
MNRTLNLVIALSGVAPLLAAVDVKMESGTDGFAFEKLPAPAINDAGSTAEWSLAIGDKDRYSAEIGVVSDGKVPEGDDDPRSNFFLGGTTGGRLVADLGETTDIGSIATYSAHPGARADQLYRVYGSTGTTGNFEPAPAQGKDPKDFGWTLLATVDTRSMTKGGGGRVGVEIGGEKTRGVGRYRYVLFDVVPPEKDQPMSQTFFSEIDIVDAKAKETLRLHSQKKVTREFTSSDGQYRFLIDATKGPDLVPWIEKEMLPVLDVWYPKLVKMLPSKGYKAPQTVNFEIKLDMPAGIPAYAAGDRISLSGPFLHGQAAKEAKGCVVHEMVHVVQNYWWGRRRVSNPKDTPTWVTEGIADYIRWFLYEPESKGAEITKGNFGSAKYDGSYRISANFIDYVVRKYNPDLVVKMNEAAREGRYEEKIWEDLTGKSVQDLGEEWREYHRKKLHIRD